MHSVTFLALFLLLSSTPDNRKVIACFGDSLTAGHGLEITASYPSVLQKQIPNWRVVNLGVSGDTTSGGLERMASVISLKPSIVVLELGANDGLRGLPLRVTRANLEQMIVAFQKAGARVVLAGMTLPPNYGPDYIKQFEQIYKDLAAKYKLALIPFFLDGVAFPGTTLMQRDGLHPTAEGQKKVAATVLKTLRPLLR